MINWPTEKDQVNMILKNLLLVLWIFEQLCDCRIKIEDAINSDHLDLNAGKPQ